MLDHEPIALAPEEARAGEATEFTSDRFAARAQRIGKIDLLRRARDDEPVLIGLGELKELACEATSEIKGVRLQQSLRLSPEPARQQPQHGERKRWVGRDALHENAWLHDCEAAGRQRLDRCRPGPVLERRNLTEHITAAEFAHANRPTIPGEHANFKPAIQHEEDVLRVGHALADDRATLLHHDKPHPTAKGVDLCDAQRRKHGNAAQ
ncbi:MAG: hypothetical protein AAFX10_05035 [Pseudomonadota bacterium]